MGALRPEGTSRPERVGIEHRTRKRPWSISRKARLSSWGSAGRLCSRRRVVAARDPPPGTGAGRVCEGAREELAGVLRAERESWRVRSRPRSAGTSTRTSRPGDARPRSTGKRCLRCSPASGRRQPVVGACRRLHGCPSPPRSPPRGSRSRGGRRTEVLRHRSAAPRANTQRASAEHAWPGLLRFARPLRRETWRRCASRRSCRGRPARPIRRLSYLRRCLRARQGRLSGAAEDCCSLGARADVELFEDVLEMRPDGVRGDP